MKYYHYSDKIIEVVSSRSQNKGREYIGKPVGFWITDNSEDNWETWSRAEEFKLECLKYKHEVELSPVADILYITTSEELVAFHEKYSYTEKYFRDRHIINWNKVADDYDGILIMPYQWKHRLDGDISDWYYSWDCSSGCIWNANAIERISIIETTS